jgi:O-antigen/teichoic acid export membrane protein
VNTPSKTQTLVKNSTATGIQILLSAAISLVTTRLLLKYLGFVDYGVLTVLGASGFYSAIFISGLNIAALRHMSFEIGLPNKGKLQATFTATVIVFFAIGASLVLVGYFAQEFIFSKLTIPPDRLSAATYVYLFVILGLGFNSLVAPFSALRQAHQHMVAISVYELLKRVLILGILLAIPYLTPDSLILISGGTLVANVVVGIILVVHSFISYPRIRIDLRKFDLLEVWRVLKFAKWSMLSMTAMQMRSQLAIILINLQFGPIANGAFALANAVNGLVIRVNGALHRALQPAMTSSHAAGDSRNLRRMMSIASRYATFFVLPIVIPLMLEMEAFLRLWVREYPDQAPLFARLVLVATVLSFLNKGYGLAVNSLDRLAESTMIFLPIQFGAFGIGAVGVLYFGAPAWTIPCWSIAGIIIQNFVYPLYFGRSTDFGLKQWLVECVMPCFWITLIGSIPAAMVSFLLIDDSVFRLFVATAISGIFLAGSIWSFGIKPDEKALLINLSRQKLKRINSVWQRST